MKKILARLKKPKATTPRSYHHIPDYIVWNIESFNAWFNAKDNKATYAHPGIFGRTDKLFLSHIQEYLEICYGIINIDELKIIAFKDQIQDAWRKMHSKRK